MVRVLPDLPAVDRAFDYLVPDALSDQVGVGARVRVALGPRRVGGWVVADPVTPPAGVAPRPLAAWSGLGPAPEVIDLARWAAWRWAGRTANFLATASPPRVVRALPEPGPGRRGAAEAGAGAPLGAGLVAEALAAGRAVVRLAPAVDPLGVVREVLGARLAPGCSVLVLVPSLREARREAEVLAREGWPVALLPEGWAAAAAGGRVVVGTRAGAWGPAPGLAGVVVVDAHDEAFQGEQAPTWVGWVVAAERARRAGVPCVATSPCPTLELLAWGQVVTDARAAERRGWPVLQVVDTRAEDPRAGLFSTALVALVREPPAGRGGPVVCVLNRTGRARLLACGACGELARCETCGGPLSQPGTAEVSVALACRRCGQERPVVCARCGATRLKVLRAGVSRVREELQALAGVAVAEVSGDTPVEVDAPVLVGTEAVLHRVARARVVAFLDLDQELLSPGFRAGEAALALLARAARVVGGRAAGGRLLVQTRLAAHEVVTAALHGDPARVTRAEAGTRAALALPPATALAVLSGPGAADQTAHLAEAAGAGVEVLGPQDGRWLARAPDHATLCDALAGLPRPRQRVRVEVDPRRV